MKTDVPVKQGIALSVMLCAVIRVMANAYPGKNSSALEDMTESQDVRSLDRRISLLEQRIYSIEARINRLQHSATSQPTPVLQPSSRPGNQSIESNGEYLAVSPCFEFFARGA